jgi:hypothetical protein
MTAQERLRREKNKNGGPSFFHSSAFLAMEAPEAFSSIESRRRVPRTISGKKPSARSLQRSREYEEWLKEQRDRMEHERYERRLRQSPASQLTARSSIRARDRRRANEAAIASGAILYASLVARRLESSQSGILSTECHPQGPTQSTGCYLQDVIHSWM